MRTIIISSDHGGFALKEKLKSYLKKKGLAVKDLGTYSRERCDYPEFAYRLGRLISGGKYQRGISVCKSGIGNSIVLNRLAGVRAALCYNAKAARLSREHNDSNVLILGSLFVREGEAKRIISVWLKTEFKGGRHQRRLNQIKQIERRCG
jgi:ribose 5-phosphate isomerase B